MKAFLTRYYKSIVIISFATVTILKTSDPGGGDHENYWGSETPILTLP